MAYTMPLLVFLFFFPLSCYATSLPSGVCFVPTRLSTPYAELTKPLITPKSDGYNKIWTNFIDPMIASMSMQDETDTILNSSMQYVGTAKGADAQQKRALYHKMMENVEVYYVDHFNNPESNNNDISVGIWAVSFGQFVFKFTQPIPGIPDTIIFNGLLPAIGVQMTDIYEWKKHPNGRQVNDEREPSDKVIKQYITDDSSPIRYDQTISTNGDKYGQFLDFWIVHSDPDPHRVFVVGANTERHRTQRGGVLGSEFSDNWVDFDDHCRAGQRYDYSIEKHGLCANADVDMRYCIEHRLKMPLQACTKIVLCKNGARKFSFKQPFTSELDKIPIYAAELTDNCRKVKHDKPYDSCQWNKLIDVSVAYEKRECPFPSVDLPFDCTTNHRRHTDVTFTDIPWKKSIFYGERMDMEYRVLPPESTNAFGAAASEGEKAATNPWKCDERAAQHRPRFQMRFANDRNPIKRIITCCIKGVPVLGQGESVQYYWPETRHFGSVSGGGMAKESDESDAEQKRDFIPASAVVGLKPSDKKWPSDRIRDSVMGHRMGVRGMSKEQAWHTVVTQEEYEEIVKNEEAVTNPADPNEHKVENKTSKLQIIHAFYFVTFSFLLILISSLFILYK